MLIKMYSEDKNEYEIYSQRNTTNLGLQKALRRNILASAFGIWNQPSVITNLKQMALLFRLLLSLDFIICWVLEISKC